jgi:phosphomannomutase
MIFLSRFNQSTAGIMITASHNPKDDNGYKVYWSNGSQIIPPHDNLIATSIENNLAPWITRYNTDESDILSHPLFHDVTSTISSAYIQSLRKILSGITVQNPVRIAYTGLMFSFALV